MIKSLIVLALLSGLIAFLMAFSDITYFLLAVKGTMIYYFGLVLSPLAITIIFFEVAWVVIYKFIKKL